METNATMEIARIKIIHEVDYNSRPDYIGKFTNVWETGTISRKLGPRNENSSKYFVSHNNVWSKWQEYWRGIEEEDKNEVIKKYGSLKKAMFVWANEDMERLENFYKTWIYIRITCKATIRITINNNVFADNIVDSLGRIENDDNTHITEIENEIIENIKSDLKRMGFTWTEIDNAFKNITRVDKT